MSATPAKFGFCMPAVALLADTFDLEGEPAGQPVVSRHDAKSEERNMPAGHNVQ